MLWFFVLLLGQLLVPAAATVHTAAAKLILRNISNWILQTSLPTNNLTNTQDSLKTSIFINGNLARVLLASSSIFDDEPAYLSTGLLWCDAFVKLQHDQDTHDGRSAGGWWDTGYSDLFIADTGTAVTCLALCYDMTHDTQRKSNYMNAMLKFSEFVVNGTSTTPKCTFTPSCQYDALGNETEVAATFLVGDGSLGDGYYEHRLNTPSYTIATATTGGAFFSELYALTGRSDFKAMATKATEWLLKHVEKNGTIPYYIYPPTTVPHEYQCTSYSTEAIVDVVHLRSLLNSTVVDIDAISKRMVDYLLRNQQPSGELIDPAVASVGEQQRSPRAMSLLQWYFERTQDPRASAAIEKYIHFLMTPAAFDPKTYGVNSFALISGFVGLALADYIQPWCTFVKSVEKVAK